MSIKLRYNIKNKKIMENKSVGGDHYRKVR
jgi:hypothetical protein